MFISNLSDYVSIIRYNFKRNIQLGKKYLKILMEDITFLFKVVSLRVNENYDIYHLREFDMRYIVIDLF